MKSLFQPAIALMNRLAYTRKFALLAFIAWVAITVVVYNLFISLNQIVQISQRELEGLTLIRPISETIQRVQRHRGLSAGFLGGDKLMEPLLATKEKQAILSFKALEDQLPLKFKTGGDWERIWKDWEILLKEGISWTMRENFAAHTRLINQLLVFEILVADEYRLPLDAELASHYLIDTTIEQLPKALENLGRIRAYGVGILATKQITEPQKVVIMALSAELDHAIQSLSLSLEKTGHYNPPLKDGLSVTSKDIANSANQAINLVESDILSEHFDISPESFFNSTTQAIDMGYQKMYETLLPTVEMLIETRISNAKKVLYTSIGTAFLLFLVAVYFSIGIYIAIIGSIRALAHSAGIFADGDMRERVVLDTQDELKQVGDSFNKMADAFNALLEAKHQAMARAQDTLQTLRDTQKSLVQSQKMAELGGLVAGVAHEINTPVGVILSAATHLEAETTKVATRYEQGELSGDELEDYFSTASQSARLVTINSHRAAELIHSFKQVAVDQTGGDRREFDLKSYIEDVILSLHPKLKHMHCKITVDCPKNIVVDGYPGALSQCLTNFITNSIEHAFDPEQEGLISIHATLIDDDKIKLVYADNGKGIPTPLQDKIFNPFFTTRRGSGGSGLGLHIVYNIAHQTLKGSLDMTSEPGQGAAFALCFPRTLPIRAIDDPVHE